MRRKLSFLVTLWWIILCGVIGVCMLLFANRSSVISEQENRTLSGFPAFSLDAMRDGEISESFESFLTDQFFLRSELVDGTNALKHLLSALTLDELLDAEGEEVFVASNVEAQQEVASPEEPTEQIEPQEETLQQEESLPETTTIDSANVWLNHKDGTRTALFTYGKEDLEKAASVLNAYAALLPVGGKLHVLLAPRAQTANKLALHLDSESGWTSEMETALQSLVSTNVVVHNAYDILQNDMLGGEHLYFRTDHHWTARGAYLVADSMLRREGYQTVPLADYKEKTIEGYLGSIYLHGRNAKLKDLAYTI